MMPILMQLYMIYHVVGLLKLAIPQFVDISNNATYA